MRAGRGITLGDILMKLLPIALLLAATIALFLLPDEPHPASTQATTPVDNSPASQQPVYYHQPVLITSSITTDPGKGAWQGLCEYLQAETPEACYLAADTVQAMEQAIEQAEQDMVPSAVIVTGDNAAEAVAACQDIYQGTYFLVLDGTLQAPAANVCCLTFAAEQAGYLAGYAAGMEGYSRLCFVAEAENEETLLYQSGFYQGADCAAQNWGKEITITTCLGKDAAEQIARDNAQMAFVCGSLDFQTVVAEQALQSGICLIGTDPDLLESRPELADTMLTFAVKNYAAVTRSALDALQTGAWNQFYGGQVLCFDLQWGEAVMLYTGQWQFANFSAAQYYQIIANLARDASYQVSRQIPTDVLERVRTE